MPHTSLDDHEPVWLTTAQAARRIGVSPRQVYRWIDHGELPAYRPARLILLRLADVDAFCLRRGIRPQPIGRLPLEPPE